MPRTKLTDLTIKHLAPPAAGSVVHWDPKPPGFGLRVTEKGVRSWVFMYRMKGRVRRLTIGRYADAEGIVTIGLKVARKLAWDAFFEVKKGNDPAAAKRAARNAPPEADTFEDAFEDFLERHAGKLRPATRGEYARIFKKLLRPRWGRRRLADLAKADVIRLIDAVMDAGTPSAANHALAVLKKFFGWCVERDLLEASPCVGVKRPHKERARDRVLGDDELRAIWNACDPIGYPFGPFIKMLIVTAQRRSEVARLRWRDVDLERRVWTIPAESTKAGRTHEVPLSLPAMEILEAAPRFRDDYVFSTTYGERPISGFSKPKVRLAALSGVADDWRFHDFRRSAATGMAELGIEVFVIGQVLNHAAAGAAAVTLIYNRHGYLSEKRGALERWGRKLTAIVEPGDEKVVSLRQ